MDGNKDKLNCNRLSYESRECVHIVCVSHDNLFLSTKLGAKFLDKLYEITFCVG